MPGLSLGTGGYGSYMGQGAVPAAAGVSPGAPTISQKAFGVYSQQTSAGPGFAGMGTVTIGLIGIGVLVWLWYSLPR